MKLDKMKWTILGFFAILTVCSGYGQAKSTIDIIGGIDYSYRNLRLNSDDEIISNILNRRNEGEVGKLNWRAGINYNRFLGKKFFLRGGLRFASVGYKTEKITELRFGSQNDGNGGIIENPELPVEIQYKYDRFFVELPIALRYELGNRKVKPFAELGLAPTFWLTERQKSIIDGDKNVQFSRDDYRPTNKMHLVGLASIGLNYSLDDRNSLFVQSLFRYHSATFAKTAITENLYSAGVEFGFRRSLAKKVEEEVEKF